MYGTGVYEEYAYLTLIKGPFRVFPEIYKETIYGLLPAMHSFLCSSFECEGFLRLTKPAQSDVMRTHPRRYAHPKALPPKQI